MSTISFTAKLYGINGLIIAALTPEASSMLPSRGQVMVKGMLNDVPFQTALEPDGKGGHWLEVAKDLQKDAYVQAGDDAQLTIESTKEWPEPVTPDDIQSALTAHPEVQQLEIYNSDGKMRMDPLDTRDEQRRNPSTPDKRIYIKA